MKRYVWFSDTHLNLSMLPFMKRRFINRLNAVNSDGLFLTGDISHGLGLESDLRFLAKNFSGPIYFVLGNHDYHRRYISSAHADVRRLSVQYSNLHWLTDEPIITLSDDIALIGTEGWYDASCGNSKWLRWTTDWFLTFDFFHMSGLEERIQAWKIMAQISADFIENKLELALKEHKTVYVMTHVPPWKEATRSVGTLFENFWLPYNTNSAMGIAIEKVMKGRKKKRVVVLAGHTHTPCHIRVNRSIECNVAKASYWGFVRPEETIIL